MAQEIRSEEIIGQHMFTKKTLTSFIPFHHSLKARGGFSN